MLRLIVAHDANRVIGNKGKLPWHCPEDLKRFRQVTSGHAVIMGRKTFESIGKPLPRRRNIVVSRQVKKIDGVAVFDCLLQAIHEAQLFDVSPLIIGGAAIYRQALHKVERMHITEIDGSHEGDTFFPGYNPYKWVETHRSMIPGATFRILDRLRGGLWGFHQKRH